MLQGMLIPVVMLLAACGGGTAGSSTAEPEGQAAGASAFAVCANCHTLKQGAPHRSGPNLHNLIGRKAGEAQGFAYSPALRGSGIVWDAQSLDEYLAAPAQRVPGTRMTHATPDAARRQAIIQYLSAPAQ